MRAWRIVAPVLLTLFTGSTLLACEKLPPHSDFELGATRAEVRARFGEPAHIREMWKTGNAAWGPIEAFWSRVPDGARVEIWSYRSHHVLVDGSQEEHAGTTELYFLDDADALAGIGFAPDGVVHQASD